MSNHPVLCLFTDLPLPHYILGQRARSPISSGFRLLVLLIAQVSKLGVPFGRRV